MPPKQEKDNEVKKAQKREQKEESKEQNKKTKETNKKQDSEKKVLEDNIFDPIEHKVSTFNIQLEILIPNCFQEFEEWLMNNEAELYAEGGEEN